jgi:ABC-type multidrug transport system fused ATPase/permease subunit
MKASIRFILREILIQWRILVAGLGLTVLGALMVWAGPVVIAGIIDEGLVTGDRDRVIRGALALAGVEALRLISAAGGQMVYAVLGQNVIERVRRRMVEHLVSLPIPYFDKVTSGGMMTRVVNDANSLTDFFQSGFVSVLGNIGSLVAAFIGIGSLSPRLGLLLFCVFLPFVWLTSRFSRQLRRVYEEMRSRLSELNSTLADMLFGMRTLRSLGLNVDSHGKLNTKVEAYAESQKGMIGTYALFHPAITLATGVFLLIWIGAGLSLVDAGELKVGGWIAGLSYVLMMQQPMTEISDRWNFFLAGITSIGRVREVLESAPERTGIPPAEGFTSLVFENVGFTYEGAQEPALSDVNLEIRKGDWIGIFGESGSGKSTLLQLAIAFLDPVHGTLKWNGRSLRDLDPSSIRGHFGVVEQFPFLFSGTVRDNITWFGKHELDRDSLLRRFEGHGLISSLLNRLDHPVSERGSNLSLGEKQMITFLRSWLAGPGIWILDEATAFFDPRAEAELLSVLESERHRGVTVIQVAHRPEALRRMNRWINVRSGGLRELTGADLPVERPDST